MGVFNTHVLRRALLTLISIAALAFAAPAQFKVTLLGTGSPQPRMDRFGPSLLVEAGEKKLLFDCGRGAAQRIEQLSIPFTAIYTLGAKTERVGLIAANLVVQIPSLMVVFRTMSLGAGASVTPDVVIRAAFFMYFLWKTR